MVKNILLFVYTQFFSVTDDSLIAKKMTWLDHV